MKQLKYLKSFDKWIKPYHLSIFEWDKSLIAKTFKVIKKKNNKYIIFVATNAYGMGIDNPDILLVIK